VTETPNAITASPPPKAALDDPRAEPLSHSSAQRWFYVPALSPDRALLIECYDLEEDGRARSARRRSFTELSVQADASIGEGIERRGRARAGAAEGAVGRERQHEVRR
jgi:hypothetical protein